MKTKNSYKVVTYYSMPDSILFVFRKRLNFIFLNVFLIVTLLWSVV